MEAREGVAAVIPISSANMSTYSCPRGTSVPPKNEVQLDLLNACS